MRLLKRLIAVVLTLTFFHLGVMSAPAHAHADEAAQSAISAVFANHVHEETTLMSVLGLDGDLDDLAQTQNATPSDSGVMHTHACPHFTADLAYASRIVFDVADVSRPPVSDAGVLPDAPSALLRPPRAITFA